MTRSAKRLIALMLLDVQTLMRALESGASSVELWQKQFSTYLAQYHTAEYLVGQRNRALTDPGRRYLKQVVEAQIGFLKNFATEIQSEAEFKMGWNARAAMYAQGIGQSYWKGATKTLPLPAMPRDGTSQCLTNCTCSWEITELDGDGNYDCYWKLGATERHCQTCPQRAQDWSPLQIRGGRLKEYRLKHLPGGHDQRSHGRATGRRVAMRSAYSAARGGGASITDSRRAARAASDYMARAQRMENIVKQQGGYMSPEGRRSSEAELQRLADAQDRYLDKVPPHLHDAVNNAISRAPITQPTVRGRVDPRPAAAARQAGHSPEAQAAHAKVLGVADATGAHVDAIRAKYNQLVAHSGDLMNERWQLEDRIKGRKGPITDIEKAAIQKQIDAIDVKRKANYAKIDAEMDKIKAINAQATDKILAVDKPGSVKLSFMGTVTPEREREIQQSIDRAMSLTASTGLNGKHIMIWDGKTDRAYAVDRLETSPFVKDMVMSGSINLDSASGPRTIAHELGHHIEFRNPEVKRRATEFLDRRTRGEAARPLSEITNNKAYDDFEVAQSDKFISPYMGKRYASGDTEIISMGLEYFYSDPLKLAKEDPDYFMFMYDVLRLP